MVQVVKFNVHVFENHGVLMVTEQHSGPRSARVISTRDLPNLKAPATPNECFRAVIEALSPTHED